MRFTNKTDLFCILALAGFLMFGAGCAATAPGPATPPKPAAPVYAMVDMQKLLERHPERAKLRQMEQALAAKKRRPPIRPHCRKRCGANLRLR